MNIEQKIIYSDRIYQVLNAEGEYMIHPAAFGLLPLSKASLLRSFSSEFMIENFHLKLNKIVLKNEDKAEDVEGYQSNELYGCRVFYSGTILIGENMVREYYSKGGKLACFSYQNVYELVFEDGILVTTVDQSKAMQRIRKNLELGLRTLNHGRDYRCIMHFINASLVGDYKSFKLPGSRYKYLKNMRNNYYYDTLIHT
jgi:hypothetical protein